MMSNEFINGQLIGREQALDEIWEWMEIGVVCEKPDPVINQLVDKIIKMREERPALVTRRKE